ncbi:MAG: hypothetical protein Kow0074_19470 [Candidatus Zixiibacteriota bacterium]
MSSKRPTKSKRVIPPVILGLVASLTILLGPGQILATEFRGGDAVHLRDGEILDDLFAAGGDVSVNSHIVGDLFAAGATVTVGDSAVIENSVAAAGQRVDINGHIVNSARTFAQDVSIRGHIERNLISFSATLILDEAGWIEKDINAFCGKMIIRGRVGGDVTGEMDEVVISGQVDGDIDIKAGDVTILPSAIIGGKLTYRAPREANIADGAQIFEGVERVAEEDRDSGYSLGSLLWDAWWFLAAVIVGVVMLVLFRRFTLDVKDTMLSSSLISLGLGSLFLVCLPVAVGVLIVTLLGVPLGILVLVVWLVLLYLAKIYAGFAVGEWLLARLRDGKIASPVVSLIVGLLILTFVTLIPYVGVLVNLMIISLGFGGFFITAYRYRTRTS